MGSKLVYCQQKRLKRLRRLPVNQQWHELHSGLVKTLQLERFRWNCQCLNKCRSVFQSNRMVRRAGWELQLQQCSINWNIGLWLWMGITSLFANCPLCSSQTILCHANMLFREKGKIDLALLKVAYRQKGCFCNKVVRNTHQRRTTHNFIAGRPTILLSDPHFE